MNRFLHVAFALALAASLHLGAGAALASPMLGSPHNAAWIAGLEGQAKAAMASTVSFSDTVDTSGNLDSLRFRSSIGARSISRPAEARPQRARDDNAPQTDDESGVTPGMLMAGFAMLVLIVLRRSAG